MDVGVKGKDENSYNETCVYCMSIILMCDAVYFTAHFYMQYIYFVS